MTKSAPDVHLLLSARQCDCKLAGREHVFLLISMCVKQLCVSWSHPMCKIMAITVKKYWWSFSLCLICLKNATWPGRQIHVSNICTGNEVYVSSDSGPIVIYSDHNPLVFVNAQHKTEVNVLGIGFFQSFIIHYFRVGVLHVPGVCSVFQVAPPSSLLRLLSSPPVCSVVPKWLEKPPCVLGYLSFWAVVRP